MAHGGARSGAGRKPGSLTTKTRELAEKAANEGITPLDYMLSLLRDEGAEASVRFEAAKAAAPYIHPRLSSIEATGKDGAALIPAVAIEFVGQG